MVNVKKGTNIRVLIIVVVLISVCLMTFLTTYSFVTSTVETNSLSQDYVFDMDINNSDKINVSLSPESKTIVDIKISNKENNGLVNYGLVYFVKGYENSKLLPNIEVYQNSNSLNNTNGMIDKDEEKKVSIVIYNKEKVSLDINFKVVLGYRNGGDLILNTNEHLIYKNLVEELISDFGGVSNVIDKDISDDMGVYSSIDNDGDTFYYRNVDKYLSIGNDYYKVLRINGDRSVRIMYMGKSIDRFESIGNVSYNSLSNDNTYVGYKYGTSSQSYESTHNNGENSNVKALLDDFYINNLYNYNKYIEDSIFCNDRAVISNGYSNLDTSYNGYNRLLNNKYSLLCNVNDSFSVDRGNKALDYKIGLITLDEVKLLNIVGDKLYWTMTPSKFDKTAKVYAFSSSIEELEVDKKADVLPVISLKENVLVLGNGTKEEPYKLILD